jgi:glycosyltransferase involved in cell wall biosynthesis
VSIVIPVYNRASMIGQSVESCLAQTAKRVEIVIVDDGSSDDLTTALAPYADRIVLRRQENRGISHARRAAIEAASGDFIHFLDSDDVLLPECIEEKLQAFAAVPDARLCYSGNVGYDPDVVWRAFNFYENPDGGPMCPTTDFLRSIVHRLPFLPSTVMMPRWVLLQIDAFKEGLRRGEDTRLWFQLAKHRPKALGIVGETIIRRYHASSLGKLLDEPTSANSIANVMNLCDLIADPRLWPSTFDYLHGMSLSQVWREINTELAPGLSDWRSRLIAAASAHGGGARPSGLSPLPLLVLMLAGLRSLSDELVSAIPSEFGFHHELESAVHAAALTAAPLTDEDVAAWLKPERFGFFGATAAATLAALAAEVEADDRFAHLVPPVRLLLQLANPAFDPERFGPMTLAALSSNRVYARPLAAAHRPGSYSRIAGFLLDRLPIGRARRFRDVSIGLLDRVIAGGPWAAWRSSIRDQRQWHALDEALKGTDASDFHLEGLRATVFAGGLSVPDDRIVLQKAAAFHARALARNLGSTERRHQMAATVVVAATGPCERLKATIASALAQTGNPVEIIVVGERHDPSLATFLSGFASKLRFVGAVRPGTVGAHNLGIAYASSDFMMIVEEGAVLEPDCVATHLAMFEARPGTGITWSPDRRDNLPFDARGTVDLMAAVAAGNSPRLGEWMAPRWRMLATGPFDRWLTDRAFARYTFRLALRQPTVALLDRGLINGGNPPISTRAPTQAEDAIAAAVDLADLLASPSHWPHCFTLADRLSGARAGDCGTPLERNLYELSRDRLDLAVSRLGDGFRRGGVSPQLAIVFTLAGLSAAASSDGTRGLDTCLLRASSSAAPVIDEDRRYLERAVLGSLAGSGLADALDRLRAGDADAPPALTAAIDLVADVMAGADQSPAAVQEASVPRSR